MGKINQVLLDDDLEAIGKGKSIAAGEDQTVLDFDGELPPASKLIEIAKANDIEVSEKGKKDKIAKQLRSGFEEMSIDKVEEASPEDIAKSVVQKMVEEDASESEIQVALIQSGIKIKKAASLYFKVMEDLGLKLSNKKRQQLVFEYLEKKEFEPETDEDVSTMVEKLTDKISDTDEKQARSLIRKYCKANDLEMPKVTRRKKGSIRDRAFNFVKENPDVDYDDFSEYVQSESPSEKSESAIRSMWKVVELAREIAQAIAAKGETDEDEDEDEDDTE